MILEMFQLQQCFKTICIRWQQDFKINAKCTKCRKKSVTGKTVNRKSSGFQYDRDPMYSHLFIIGYQNH